MKEAYAYPKPYITEEEPPWIKLIEPLIPFLTIAIVPNLIEIVIIKLGYNVSHFHINVDYFYLAAASVLLPIWLTSISLLILLLVNTLVTLSDILHFPLIQAFSWVNQTSSSIKTQHVNVIATYMLLTLASFALFIWLPNKKISLRNALYFLVIALTLTGTRLLQDGILNETYLSKHRVVTSGLYRLKLISHDFSVAFRIHKPIIYSTIPPGQLASNKLFGQIIKNKEPNHHIALILVESLGLITDPLLKNEIDRLFDTQAIKERYWVKNGTVAFQGATQNGEFRELCNVTLHQYGRENLPTCLPNYLKNKGFETISYHGHTRYFYDRYYYYPRIGFSKSYFYEDLKEGGHDLCRGAFLGICDTSLAQTIKFELTQKSHAHLQFIYWLTLTSHLYVDHDVAQTSNFDCSSVQPLKDDTLCDYFKVLHQTLSSITEIATDENIEPTQFIIVGDHSPGFLREARRHFFSSEEVPYFILEPK